MDSENNCCVLVFTAVKRKKIRHFQDFRTFEFESVTKIYVHEVRMKTMHNMSRQTEFHADKTCARQLLHFEHIHNVQKRKF